MHDIARGVAARTLRCGRLAETACGLLDLATGHPARLSADLVTDREPRTWQPATCWSQPLASAGDEQCIDAWLTQDWLGRWVARGVHVRLAAGPERRVASPLWPPGAWCGPAVFIAGAAHTSEWLALAAEARREGVVPVHLDAVAHLAPLAAPACPPLLLGVPASCEKELPTRIDDWVRRGGRVHGLVQLPQGFPSPGSSAGQSVHGAARPAAWPGLARTQRALRRAWLALPAAPLLPAHARIPLSPGDRPLMTHHELLDVTTQIEDARHDAEAVLVACRAARSHLRAAHTAVVASGGSGTRVLATDGPPGDSPLAWRDLCGRDAPGELVSSDGWHMAMCHVVDQGRVWMCARWPTRAAAEGLVELMAVFARLIATRVPWTDAAPRRDAGPEHMLVGDSIVMQDVRAQIALAARAPFPVLIRGESGCGKELAARAIHALGARRHRRVAAINCAALPDDLIESELFGHVRGAFTGASSDRSGLFDEADGGTLFLDEVGELGGRAQAKLLRVLQDGEVRRVGENQARRVDVRIIAATNVSLEDAVRRGTFRADLFYRLDVVRVRMPALRERRDDIPQLARHFWEECTARVGSRARLEGRVLDVLARHDWPGNVRQLQNTLAALAVRVPPRGRVSVDDLPPEVRRSGPASGYVPAGGLDAARREFEASFVREALTRAGGRPSTAARDLGLTRQGLSKLVRRLGLDEGEPGGSRLP